jgi:hypothetical protein
VPENQTTWEKSKVRIRDRLMPTKRKEWGGDQSNAKMVASRLIEIHTTY